MISVIMPTFNRGYTIIKSIQSVLNQSYNNIELIIIDDNSTDNTKEIIESIKDRRVRYIRLEQNVGANSARNIGIENAKGEIIAFQDSDDQWKINKLETQLKELKNRNLDIVASSFFQHHKGSVKKLPQRSVNEKNLLYRILLSNFMSTQTIMGYRKCFIKEKFDENMPRFQDWELAIRLVKNFKVGFIDEALVDVYVQENSISRNHIKAVEALNIMMKKYDFEINKFNLKKDYYRKMGVYCCLANMNKKDILYYFKKIYYSEKNLSNSILYFFSKINLIKYIYKIKYKDFI